MVVNQLKAGAFLSYISIVLHNIIGLLYTPFMLRMLGQSEYGLYSLVESVVAYLTILDLGFGNAIIRYTAKFRAEGKVQEQWEMFGMFFMLYVVIGIVAFAAGLILYFNTDSMFSNTMDEEEMYKINVMMLLMVFNIAFTFPMSIWGGNYHSVREFCVSKDGRHSPHYTESCCDDSPVADRVQSHCNGRRHYYIQCRNTPHQLLVLQE